MLTAKPWTLTAGRQLGSDVVWGDRDQDTPEIYLDLSLVETINFNIGKGYGGLTLAHEYSI